MPEVNLVQAVNMALARALETLIGDSELRLRLGSNGPSSVANFTEEHFANAWVELIETCTGSGPAEAGH